MQSVTWDSCHVAEGQSLWQKDRAVASVSVFVTDKTLDMNNLSEESGFCSILFFLDRVFRSLKLVLVSVL